MFKQDFILATLTNFFFFLSFNFYFLLPKYIVHLGGNEKHIGIIMGSSGFVTIFIIPFIGAVIDKYGIKLFIILGILLMCSTSALFLIVKELNIPFFILLRLIQGLAFALTFVSTGTLAADTSPPDKRAEYLGYYGIFTLLTHSFGPWLAELVILKYGYSYLFICASVSTLIALVFSIFIKINSKEKLDEDYEKPPFSLFQIIWKWQLQNFLFTTMIIGAVFSGIFVFIPTYAIELGIKNIGPFFTSYSFSAVLIRAILGRLSDKYGGEKIIPYTITGMFLSVMIVLLSRSIMHIVLSAIILGLSQGMFYPTMNATILGKISNRKIVGRAMGLYIGSFNIGTTVAPFFLGFIAHKYSYNVMFSVVVIFTIFAFLIFPKETRS